MIQEMEDPAGGGHLQAVRGETDPERDTGEGARKADEWRSRGRVRGSLFERLGGFARIRLLVSDFYAKVLESEQLSAYFQGTDMKRLIDHQTKFISAVMGGPAAFTDEQLSRSHHRLGISHEDFEEVAELFRETLEDNQVEAADVELIHSHLLSFRRVIVGDSDGPGG